MRGGLLVLLDFIFPPSLPNGFIIFFITGVGIVRVFHMLPYPYVINQMYARHRGSMQKHLRCTGFVWSLYGKRTYTFGYLVDIRWQRLVAARLYIPAGW